ncbi:hypothetical protein [Paenibacillus sp. CF384]|uniref:hypothetical protein n=1 Tax=Paenibacillus sp. CF384 TaxID=1884382 RepID=UPI000895430F|nr:hypothetical protein [Paenibacillus sp. CF384]SDW14074.1 hypothetical protein SAMN05518855_1001394 [Paenibacillus sp. CF384]
MFEPYDALLYALSICTLVSLAYLCFVWIPTAADDARWTRIREADMPLSLLKKPPGTVLTQRQRLTRHTKRKEAPDDDSSPCMTLLIAAA